MLQPRGKKSVYRGERRMVRMKKRLCGILAAVMLVTMATGCGSSGKSTSSASDYRADYNESAVYDEGVSDSADTAGIASGDSCEMAEEAIAENTSAGNDTDTDFAALEEKLVYHCDMSIETTDYAASLQGIRDIIDRYHAIIQSENESDDSYDWYYEDYCKTSGTLRNYIEIRVPSADYQNFLNELDGVGKVISKSTSVDNISQEYYDTSVQIEALEVQEKNLLAMLEECDSIEDMITVQDRLTEVTYQLNKLKTHLRGMDTDVAYSYVNINLTEVMEYRQDDSTMKNTFLTRLKKTFVSTWTGFLKFLEVALFAVIHLIPYAILAALIYLLICKPLKKWKQKRRQKKEEKRAEKKQE